MSKRNRGFPQSHSSINLPGESSSSPIPSSPSSTFLSFPRATSPSSITGFLSKPSKWFSRPSPKLPAPPGSQEPPRLSNSSSSRRPTISGPTDPRPILAAVKSEGRVGASRSVLDLSLSRTQTNAEGRVGPGQELGELRSVSRKGWSRSVDDLGKFPSTQVPSVNTTNIKVSTSPPGEDSASPTKAMIEAYRQNSPQSPHSLHPHYPFPTIQTTTPSPPSPPTTAAGRSIPEVAVSPAHGRSYSHAPYQSSKLASPSSLAPEHSPPPPLPQPLPPSSQFPPQPRNRTASSFEREREKARRTGFPFPHSSHAASNKLQAANSTTTEAGATSNEAVSSPAVDSKRTSQIVHYSGFINRQPDPQPLPRTGYALSAALSKGWKPYKAVLKGSKLYFYKPTGDRALAIKELFPQGMESVAEERPETVQEEPEPPGRILGKEKEDVRKRTRLYRGRAAHPELSVGGDGSVVRASSDALIHEAVFGTSFSREEPNEAQRRWKHFASAIVLCLPRLIGRAKFEDEFIRYSSYLLSGAEEADKPHLRSRTVWLAEQYLLYQGGPVNETSWSTFQEEFIPSISSPAAPSSTASVLNSSSPGLDAFSPRPSQSQKVPTFSAVVSPPRPSLSRSSSSQPRINHASFWAAVEQEGLTSDVLLKLDSTLVSRSLVAFHRNVLAGNQKRFVGADLLDREAVYEASPDERDGQADGFENSQFAIFFGSEEQPHWLTRFIVVQILNASGGASEASSSVPDTTSQVSNTHFRAELINKWARIGERCRATGDQCSWKAIEAALCSRPIARLDRVWRRVDHGSLRYVQAWIKDAGEYQLREPRLTPWGGDARERVAHLLQRARLESSGSDQWDTAVIEQILDRVEPIVENFAPFNGSVVQDAEEEDVSQFARIWQALSEQPPPRSPNLNQYLALSLAAEPRQRGRFEPYHWQRQLNSSPVHTLVPLLFVEPLPTVTLINRDLIYRGKKDSMDMVGSHPGLDPGQVSRMTRMKSSPEVRRSSDIKILDSSTLAANSERSGPVLQLYDGELLLMVPNNLAEPTSRPPSSLEAGLERRPSQIRVNNPGLERKTSLARRNSLPSISQRSSLILPEPTAEGSLRVIVKAGTLDRLVQVLVSGVEGVPVSVTDDNGEMPLRDGKMRMLKLDAAEFRMTWWSVFRSFVSPLVLFELLRKRFLQAEVTPGTSVVVPRVRIDIFLTINRWFENGGALDALGDSELFDSMKTFLATTTITQIPECTNDDDRVSWSELENARQNTLATFISQTSRPNSLPLTARDSHSTFPSRNHGKYPPSIDDIDPETLVNNLDAMVAATLRSATQEDFFITIDLLEIQTVDRTGWFLSHEPSTSYDDLEIQTLYSHLQQIEPSPLISEMSQESFYKLLPPSIRSLIRAHAVIRKWAIACIVAPHLGLRTRQTRVETILRAIEVCRLRMAEVPVPEAISSQRSVRSFVETALIAALVSPESRVFSFMWLNVAAARNTGTDTIAALLMKPVIESTVDKSRLTVDVGWLLERFLEVISLPNIIDADGETLSLINFEKRRTLCDLVLGALSPAPTRHELDRLDIERLNHMHRDVTGPPFDIRLLKEEAYHESINLVPQAALPKKNQRPFLRITQTQQDKYKRDKLLRERLHREKRAEQHRTEKREDDLNRAMQATYPNSQSLKNQRSRRTMSSAFFQLMRPLSSAFSSDNIYASTQRRTAAELDFDPTGKPALVVSLVGATVTPFINNFRLYTFHLTTEDGDRHLLQASTRAGMTSWLAAISKTAKSSTAKRLTYVANAPKPQLSDHIQTPSQSTAHHPTKVFGVELSFLIQREAGREAPPGVVPRILEQCLAEIEARGLHEVGLYRIPGATSAINALKQEFDNGGEVTFFLQDYVDIWAVCDVVKSFFRELPHPMFPERSYLEVLRVMKIPDFEERLMAVRDVVHGLPVHHFYALRRICEHLERVTDYEENNQMTAQALSVLFNPSLLRSPFNDFGVMMTNMKFTSQLLQTLIVHFHRVFDESEADVDQDEEGETNVVNVTAGLDRVDSRSSSVPTDAIHDHDPDLEPLPSTHTPDPETLDSFVR